ncbi:transcription initiation factor IIB family protein [Salinigranum halophilum]|uniref:hypothetical protein n=1 Tax=Salinigranum halophilum TaxID=2565931 RepID=UPI00115E0378|nr:hypothetical protein [Salinigranum halophilum]
MAINDVYEQTFDEDVPAETHATGGCPECGGTVLTNSIETNYEDCSLVLEDCPLDYGLEWRSFEDEPEDRKRTGPPLTPTRHDRGSSLGSLRGTSSPRSSSFITPASTQNAQVKRNTADQAERPRGLALPALSYSR